MLAVDKTYTARVKWYNIGLGLEVSVDTLDSIRERWDDDGDRLREMFKPWLKGINPTPTWKALIAALRRPSVGENELAGKLEKEFCPEAREAQGKSYVIRVGRL